MPNDINKSPQIKMDESVKNIESDPQPTNIATLIPPKKSPLIPFLISSVVILTGVGGFFAYKYFTSSKTPPTITPISKEAIAPTPSPTPILTPESQTPLDPTSDWLSYTDQAMGLTFKYPPTWDYHYLNQNPPSIMIAPQDIVTKVKNAPGGFGGGAFLTMIISLHDYDPTPQTDEFSNVVSQPTTIDSKEFTHHTSTFLQEGPGFASGEVIQDYIAPLENQFLKIGLFDLDQKDILDQIVSSITIN